jgi:starch synthase
MTSFSENLPWRVRRANVFPDNDERAIFFARGVIETVKKLNWAPDVVHCNGWFTSLMPFYIKVALKENPMFSDTKVIYSVYNDAFTEPLNSDLAVKMKSRDVTGQMLEKFQDTSYLGISKTAVDFSDGIIFGDEVIDPELEAYIRQSGKPVLDYQDREAYIDAYNAFYDEILVKESILTE